MALQYNFGNSGNITSLGEVMSRVGGFGFNEQAVRLAEEEKQKSILAQQAIRNQMDSEDLDLRRAVGQREAEKYKRDVAGDDALRTYTSHLGNYGSNVVPEADAMAVQKAYAANPNVDVQAMVDAAQKRYNADTTEGSKARTDMLNSIAMPGGDYDPTKLITTKDKAISDIAIADKDRKTDEYRADTLTETIRAHKAGEGYNSEQLNLLQQKYNDEVDTEKAVGKAITIPKEISYFDTPKGSLVLDNANKTIEANSTVLNDPGSTDIQKKQAQANIDSIARQIKIADKKVSDPNYGDKVAAILGTTPKAYTAFKNVQDLAAGDLKTLPGISKQEEANIEANKQIKIDAAKLEAEKQAGKYKSIIKDSSQLGQSLYEAGGSGLLWGTSGKDLEVLAKRYYSKYPNVPKSTVDSEIQYLSQGMSDSVDEDKLEKALNKYE